MGETGGKDFVIVHPSADPAALDVLDVGDRDAHAQVGADRHANEFHIEVVGRLREGRMRAFGCHHLRTRNPAILAGHVTRGLYRLEEAFRATRREVALHRAPARRVVGTEQRGGVADDVVLHDADAGKGQDVETVFGAVEREGILEKLVYFVAGGVHQAEDAATPPILVVLLHGLQLVHDLVACQPMPRNGRVRN